MATVQIRTYTVRAGRLDEWVDAWRTLIVPLRRRFGFDIAGSWIDRERNAHIWVISFAGNGHSTTPTPPTGPPRSEDR